MSPLHCSILRLLLFSQGFCATKAGTGKYSRRCHAEDQVDSRMEVRLDSVVFAPFVSTLCSSAKCSQIQPGGVGGSDSPYSGDKERRGPAREIKKRTVQRRLK